MLRSIVGVGAVTVGLFSGCDQGEAAKNAAETARLTAELGARDQQIVGLEQQVAKLSAKPADPAPVTAPPRPQLDAELERAAGTAEGVQKFELEVEADGSLRELAVYHNDASVLPAAVLALQEQQYPGSKVRVYEIEFDRDHGRVFEVEVTTADKQECEYSAKPDGTLVYNECHIDPKALSEAVQAAIPKAVPGAKLLTAEKKTYPDGRTIHSVELSAAGKTHELYFENDAMIRHELVFDAKVEVPAP